LRWDAMPTSSSRWLRNPQQLLSDQRPFFRSPPATWSMNMNMGVDRYAGYHRKTNHAHTVWACSYRLRTCGRWAVGIRGAGCGRRAWRGCMGIGAVRNTICVGENSSVCCHNAGSHPRPPHAGRRHRLYKKSPVAFFVLLFSAWLMRDRLSRR
jgi:hypothetical protein